MVHSLSLKDAVVSTCSQALLAAWLEALTYRRALVIDCAANLLADLTTQSDAPSIVPAHKPEPMLLLTGDLISPDAGDEPGILARGAVIVGDLYGHELITGTARAAAPAVECNGGDRHAFNWMQS
jgi:hypothetical protein